MAPLDQPETKEERGGNNNKRARPYTEEAFMSSPSSPLKQTKRRASVTRVRWLRQKAPACVSAKNGACVSTCSQRCGARYPRLTAVHYPPPPPAPPETTARQGRADEGTGTRELLFSLPSPSARPQRSKEQQTESRYLSAAQRATDIHPTPSSFAERSFRGHTDIEKPF